MMRILKISLDRESYTVCFDDNKVIKVENNSNLKFDLELNSTVIYLEKISKNSELFMSGIQDGSVKINGDLNLFSLMPAALLAVKEKFEPSL